ncbi:MAG: hypothetical protein JWL81_158 [Verrucomicrobiales bacterium]|nr:hypothetical protein [Verrucomicrobiales bacterium]
MKLTIPALALLLAFSPAHAAFMIFPDGAPTAEGGVKDALEAYKRGDFPEALKLFSAEADRGDKEAQFALGRIYQEGSGVAQSIAKAEEYYRKAALSGHANAQSNLGIILLNTQRADEGIALLRKAAKGGSTRAMVLMGNLLLTGTGIPKNPTEAKTMLEQAADKGDPEAYESLSLMYETGEGVEKNPGKAIDLLENAAKRNSVKALLRLAIKNLNGDGTAKNPGKTVELLTRASELGSTDAQTALGSMFETGEGVLKNAGTAITWYTKAAEAGDPNAALKLGVLFSEGAEGVEKDDRKAMESFRRAADRGQTVAMYNVGTYYEKGRGVAANPAESLKWHLKAAMSGLGLAQREIGLRYREGRGMVKDSVAAISWLGRAAGTGDTQGALALADMLLTGEGGMAPDVKNAIAILTRASELGLAPAQVRLAEVHASGVEGRPDLIRAYALTLAAGKDFEPAVKLKTELEGKMSKEQLAEANKEYERLKAKPAEAPAAGAAKDGAGAAKGGAAVGEAKP